MNDNKNHKACPFCGKVPHDIKENVRWTGLRSQLISVEIVHHCTPDINNAFNTVFIKVRGDNEEGAWKIWNRRSCA